MYTVITKSIGEFILNNTDKTDHEIGRIFNINPYTVRGFRQRNGVFKPKNADFDKEEFIKIYTEQGKIYAGKYFHLSRSTVRKYAKQFGVYTNERILTPEQELEIVNRYETDKTSMLASEYGCSESKISQVWTKHNLRGKERRVYAFENQRYFQNIDSSDKAYYLGFIASDGCVARPKKYGHYDKQDILRITISRDDDYILQKFNELVKTDKPLMYRGKYVSLELSSNQMVEDVRNHGLDFRKTYGNTIADVPREYMPDFIRGYIDGDGSIRAVDESYSDINVSISGFESNMRKISEYLLSVNILSGFTVDKRTVNQSDGDRFGTLIIQNKTQKYSLLKLIYKNANGIYLTRKSDIAFEFIKYIEQSENTRDKQIVIYYNNAVQSKC